MHAWCFKSTLCPHSVHQILLSQAPLYITLLLFPIIYEAVPVGTPLRLVNNVHACAGACVEVCSLGRPNCEARWQSEFV